MISLKLFNFYRPQQWLRKGNVFTSVCHEFCPQEMYSSVHWSRPPRACIPPCIAADTPWAGIPACTGTDTPMATAADGTYPTGMLSCCQLNSVGVKVHDKRDKL